MPGPSRHSVAPPASSALPPRTRRRGGRDARGGALAPGHSCRDGAKRGPTGPAKRTKKARATTTSSLKGPAWARHPKRRKKRRSRLRRPGRVGRHRSPGRSERKENKKGKGSGSGSGSVRYWKNLRSHRRKPGLAGRPSRRSGQKKGHCQEISRRLAHDPLLPHQIRCLLTPSRSWSWSWSRSWSPGDPGRCSPRSRHRVLRCRC